MNLKNEQTNQKKLICIGGGGHTLNLISFQCCQHTKLEIATNANVISMDKTKWQI